MRGLCLLLILAVCLAALSCRSPKMTSTRLLTAPPAATETVSKHHGQPASASSKDGLINSPGEASDHNTSAPVVEVSLGQQQATFDAAVTTQLPVTDPNQNFPSAKIERPILGAIFSPDNSNYSINASTSGIRKKEFSVNLLAPLTSTPKRVVSATLPRFHDDPMSTDQFTNRIPLPSIAGFNAQNVSPGDQSNEAIMIIDLLLKDNATEEHRLDDQINRQEAERKARETERDNLNRVFYHFLLGKQPAAGNN